ncbi:MAG: hypothetical protein QM660_00535 [Dysgonomonas sp.]
MTAKQIRYIARVLFLLYVGYYSCVSYFVHTHVYDGVVYVHSHPYNKQEKTSSENDRPPFETHTHNAAGFFAINQMSNAISYEASINNIISDVDVIVHTIPYNIVEDQKAVRASIRLFNLRAPPII